MDKRFVKKLLSHSVHTSLTTLLQVCYEPPLTNTQQDPHEKLQAYLSKLFSYASIMELHNDHLEEMAETLQGLYAEQDDLNTYCYAILQYLDIQIGKQTTKKNQYITKIATSNYMQCQTPIHALDIQYCTMTHTDGYHAQHTNMYMILQDCLLAIIQYADTGKRK